MTNQKYLKCSDEEAIGKTYLAQRRKGRQGSEKQGIIFFAAWRLGAINFLAVV
jgi:hypothetical protein